MTDITTERIHKQYEVEKLFAAAVYSGAEWAVQEAGWLDPAAIRDPNIRAFWERVKEGEDAFSVANDVGITSEIFSWVTDCPDTSRPEEYGRQIVRHDYMTRVVAELSSVAKEAGRGDAAGVYDLIQALAAMSPFTASKFRTAADIAEEFPGKVEGIRSIPSGIPKMDKALGELELQVLHILAGRPSMGKSSLASQISRNVAASGKKALVFSLEMSEISWWARMACGAAGVEWRRLRTKDVTDDEEARVYRKSNELMATLGDNLIIDETPGAKMAQIWQSVATIQPALVVIDHARLVGDRNDNEVIRMGEISYGAKAIAKTFDCHMLLLCQLSRAVEHRSNKEPNLADLRDSGRLEEDADIVTFIYRPGLYYEDMDDSETKLLVKKNRDGPTATIKLWFDKKAQWFEEKNDFNPFDQAEKVAP